MNGLRVLVTGADGFIGSHLAERLVKEGARVRALCMYNSNGSYGWLDDATAEIRSEMELRLGDIRDAEVVGNLVRGVEVVFHLAALIAIPYSYVAPESFIDTNVRGTFNVLQAGRQYGVGRIVQTSTSEVYGTPDTLPITEAHPLRAQSPYSATKIAADKLCEAWASSFETPVVILRPFNTFGPRQSARAIIPTVLGQMLCGFEEVRLGSVETRRDFSFVDDTVDAFVRSADAQLDPGEVIQLGTGNSVSIGELVKAAGEVLGRSARIVTDPQRVRPAASEVLALQSDARRARARLGWEPSVSLEEGLGRTAAWLRPRVTPELAQVYRT